VLDLLTVALAARLDRRRQVPPDSTQHAVLLQVYAFIEEHLSDPGLSPRTIADAHHISTRYLYKLFEAKRQSVADWVRHRRMWGASRPYRSNDTPYQRATRVRSTPVG
jgi:AraC-like DNA-binding protein